MGESGTNLSSFFLKDHSEIMKENSILKFKFNILEFENSVLKSKSENFRKEIFL